MVTTRLAGHRIVQSRGSGLASCRVPIDCPRWLVGYSHQLKHKAPGHQPAAIRAAEETR